LGFEQARKGFEKFPARGCFTLGDLTEIMRPRAERVKAQMPAGRRWIPPSSQI
jgi:hypothetical protein